ncbi:hypothetical protein BG004_008441 [Podila humilis]|nr:hypothetical protein BG004_008441 [Podila humilis]
MSSIDLSEKAHSLLSDCNGITTLLEEWKARNPTLNVDGLQKLTSTLLAEQKFLQKVSDTAAEDIKAVQITSSNVPYLKALVYALVASKNPVAVRKVFSYALDQFTAIDATEKFSALPSTKGHGGPKGSRQTIAQLPDPSAAPSPVPLAIKNIQSRRVKVDLVADHGKSWLCINAGSAWSLIHEFAGMEDDSDLEEEEDDYDDDNNSENDTEEGGQRTLDKGQVHGRGNMTQRPIHVSRDTHPDMTLFVRSLVLAADQNRLHYFHRPIISVRFAGIQPHENTQLEEMIYKSIRVGRVASSIADDSSVHAFPVHCVLGSMEPLTDISTMSKSTAALDASFEPFRIPVEVDDMTLFSPTLHLDITTMMALSSYLCHTIYPDPSRFNSPPLILQAKQERESPLLPLLAKVMNGRERLVISRAAASRFKSILSVIGGPEEQWRGAVLIHDPQQKEETLEKKGNEDEIKARWRQGSDWARQYNIFSNGPPRIEVIEDEDTITTTTATLSLSESEDVKEDNDNDGNISTNTEAAEPLAKVTRREKMKIADLHTKIFMTGYRERFTTLTANLAGFRSVVKTHHVPEDISIWFHSPRSLAEAKLLGG